MRNFINIVSEANLPSKVKDREKTLAPTVSLNTASELSTVDATQRGLANLDPAFKQQISAHSGNILRDLEAIAPGGDVDAPVAGYADGYAEPQTAENLPAIVSKSLAQISGEDFNPEWHQIKNLPGMMQRGVEMVAGQIFGQFTDLPVREIQMLCTILNPEIDVRKMASLIRKYGTREDMMEYDFSASMPAYQALAGKSEAQLWRAFGYEFLLMRDNGGHYVYAWPETTKKMTDHHSGAPRLTEEVSSDDWDKTITALMFHAGEATIKTNLEIGRLEWSNTFTATLRKLADKFDIEFATGEAREDMFVVYLPLTLSGYAPDIAKFLTVLKKLSDHLG